MLDVGFVEIGFFSCKLCFGLFVIGCYDGYFVGDYGNDYVVYVVGMMVGGVVGVEVLFGYLDFFVVDLNFGCCGEYVDFFLRYENYEYVDCKYYYMYQFE